MFLLGVLVGVIAVLVLAIILSALKVSGGDEDERQDDNTR